MLMSGMTLGASIEVHRRAKMTAADERSIATLQILIATCKDAEQGYDAAAQAMDDPALKTLFERLAQQRAQFVDTLETEVGRLGGAHAAGGSVTGATFRGWLNIRTAVTGGDDGAILSECERGEDAGLENYKLALKAGLPARLQGAGQLPYP